MKNVNHRQVVKTLEIFESPTALRTVVEYLFGGSLYDLMECRGRLRNRNCVASRARSSRVLHTSICSVALQGHRHFKVTNFDLLNFYDDC